MGVAGLEEEEEEGGKEGAEMHVAMHGGRVSTCTSSRDVCIACCLEMSYLSFTLSVSGRSTVFAERCLAATPLGMRRD